MLYWTGRVPTYAALRPTTKAQILATPRPGNQPAESMPIARRPRPRRAVSYNRFLCATPEQCRSHPSSLLRDRAKKPLHFTQQTGV